MNVFLTIFGIIIILGLYAYFEKKYSIKKKETEKACMDLAFDIHNIFRDYTFSLNIITSRFKKDVLNQKLSLRHAAVKGYVYVDLIIDSNLITIKMVNETYTILQPTDFCDILDKLKFVKKWAQGSFFYFVTFLFYFCYN